MPSTTFSDLTYSFKYVLLVTAPCTGNTQPSTVVGDTTNSFCIDPTHIAPLNDPKYGYFADLKNGTMPSFAFIESGSGFNDEHPGSGQSVLAGQMQVSGIINALMTSSSWKDSAYFLDYDEGGGPYEHVPPVPGRTNDWTRHIGGGELSNGHFVHRGECRQLQTMCAYHSARDGSSLLRSEGRGTWQKLDR